jgi:hypothetical protein
LGLWYLGRPELDPLNLTILYQGELAITVLEPRLAQGRRSGERSLESVSLAAGAPFGVIHLQVLASNVKGGVHQ